MVMTRREQRIALAGLLFTIIGATWYLGSTLASEADVREAVNGVERRLASQIAELRGYLVDHLDDHDGD